MNPDIVTTRVVNERPDDCEHCGLEGVPAVAAVYWESDTSTTFGYTEACGPCLPRKVDDAYADTRGRVTVEHLIVEPAPAVPAWLVAGRHYDQAVA